MSYELLWDKEAKKQLKRLDKSVGKKIYDDMKKTADSVPNPADFAKPLRGKLKGFWRYRVGDYRVVCRINENDLKVSVVDVFHRSRGYMNLSFAKK